MMLCFCAIVIQYKDLTVNGVDEAPMLGGLFDAVGRIIACCSLQQMT